MVAEDDTKDDTKNIVNSVLRACALVELTAAEGPDLGLSHAADALGLSRPTAHRLLNTLVRAGWMRRTGSGTYTLTPRLFSIGAAVSPAASLREIARPVVHELTRATGDTVYLFVPEGDQVLCIERMEGAYPVRVHSIDVGDLVPRLLGAAPKAMAQALDDDYEGHVVSRDNATPGVSAVGAAIFDKDGRVAAGISVTGVEARLDGSHLDDAIRHVRAAAREISGLLGHAEGAHGG